MEDEEDNSSLHAELIDEAELCPWCLRSAQLKQDRRQIEHSPREGARHNLRDTPHTWLITVYYCSFCDRPKIHVYTRQGGRQWEDTVYPETHGRFPPPEEVPEGYSRDYLEACAVLRHSPQASAALSRRILQSLLQTESQIRRRSLYEEIEAAEQVLPPVFRRTLHALREFGNFAAHARRDVVGEVVVVDREEAEFCLDIIEKLFEHYFVEPAAAERMLEKFNKDKAIPCGREPL